MPVWYAITAAVAVALFGLGAWLCLLGAWDRVGRRAALGAILVVIGLVWLWLASGGSDGGLAMPRGYVVVIGEDCPDEDVQSVIESLPKDAAVSFVRLSTTAAPRPQDAWSSRSLLAADRSELARLRARSGAVAWSEPKWLEKVAEACANAHGERSVVRRHWAKPTVLVVRDTGERWRTLSPRNQDVGAIANKLKEADIQVFVTDSRKPSRSGRLSIVLDRQPVEAGSLTYRDEKLQITGFVMTKMDGDTRGGAAVTQYAPPPQSHGITTKQKLVVLAGAAALYYLYKKHKAKANQTGTQGQYYLSQNGRVYYRDANHQAHWVTPPPGGIQVPESEAADYSNFQGYDNRQGGRDLQGLASE